MAFIDLFEPEIVEPTRLINMRTGEPFDIRIDRRSIWGNPASHLVHAKAELYVRTRAEAVAYYENYLLTERPDLIERLPELFGKTLGCWCVPKLCHGTVLIKLLRRYHFSLYSNLSVI